MIKIKKLNHRYNNRKENAVRDVSLHIRRGENVAIIGSSGSGKSTLLKCMNKLIEPTSGNILINDEDIINANKNDVNRIRSKIGMIFQNFNLIERNTVLSNVLNGRLSYNNSLSTLFGRFSKEDHLIANENLKRVGLT
ncbi:ATP-binding cassette domain-containing protein, partial [archaeon]|nr:ATP-binding cassette domain-containing protein [archaeon]